MLSAWRNSQNGRSEYPRRIPALSEVAGLIPVVLMLLHLLFGPIFDDRSVTNQFSDNCSRV
jgi:hypothetical protein